jgi:hypothetical protein
MIPHCARLRGAWRDPRDGLAVGQEVAANAPSIVLSRVARRGCPIPAGACQGHLVGGRLAVRSRPGLCNAEHQADRVLKRRRPKHAAEGSGDQNRRIVEGVELLARLEGQRSGEGPAPVRRRRRRIAGRR